MALNHGNKKLHIIIFSVSYTCDAMRHTLSGKLLLLFTFFLLFTCNKICNVKTDADTHVFLILLLNCLCSLQSSHCFPVFNWLVKKDIDCFYLKIETTQNFWECLYIHIYFNHHTNEWVITVIWISFPHEASAKGMMRNSLHL